MGVPKFFRWVTARYPGIMSGEIDNKKKANEPPVQFDHLLLDMNGIIHFCTHTDATLGEMPSMEEIMLKMTAYLDRFIAVVHHKPHNNKPHNKLHNQPIDQRFIAVVKPLKTMFIAVDGVAPRAKLNQQRSRRFRSARERLDALAAEPWQALGGTVFFDSNSISPGTELMRDISMHLRAYIHNRLQTNELWQHLSVFYSGHEVPGEGEHKVLVVITSASNHLSVISQAPFYFHNLVSSR